MKTPMPLAQTLFQFSLPDDLASILMRNCERYGPEAVYAVTVMMCGQLRVAGQNYDESLTALEVYLHAIHQATEQDVKRQCAEMAAQIIYGKQGMNMASTPYPTLTHH